MTLNIHNQIYQKLRRFKMTKQQGLPLHFLQNKKQK